MPRIAHKANRTSLRSGCRSRNCGHSHGLPPDENPMIRTADPKCILDRGSVKHEGHTHDNVLLNAAREKATKAELDTLCEVLSGLTLLLDTDGEKGVTIDKYKERLLEVSKMLKEGCPCCTAGLDFDEFAVAIKEIVDNGKVHETVAHLDEMVSEMELVEPEGVGHLADFNDGGHWGISFLSGFFGVIGLTAAYRNIFLSLPNIRKLNFLIKFYKLMLQEQTKKTHQPNDAVVRRCKAHIKTLEYSRLDGWFNFFVPGVVNGGASSLVLSTIIFKNPFALPVIALYAALQLGRNGMDLVRILGKRVERVSKTDSELVQLGKNKVNQVRRSKANFYGFNALGFAAFAVGGALTFAAAMTPAGPVILGVGLALLAAGALSTGIMNNIYPRLFKPRNGDLGERRLELVDEQKCLEAIAKKRQIKSALKGLRREFTPKTLWGRTDAGLRKFGFMCSTALPELAGWVPDKWLKAAGKAIPWLRFGSSATALRHERQKERMFARHINQDESLQIAIKRNDVLAGLTSGQPLDHSEDLGDSKLVSEIRRTWSHLRNLGLAADVAAYYNEERFTDGKFHRDCCSPCGHDHEGEHHHHHDLALGFVWNDETKKQASFHIDVFLDGIREIESKEANRQLGLIQAAVDSFLIDRLENQLRDDQYGIIDFYQAMARA